MLTQNDLKLFCQEVFTSEGSLVELSPQGLMEVVLSDALSKQFEGKSYLNLLFSREMKPDYPEAEFIASGHPTLDQIIQISTTKGLTTRLYLNNLRISTERLPEKIKQKITFHNCKSSFLSSAIEVFSYAMFNFKIAYLTDEKKEEIKTVVVDLYSLGINHKLFSIWNELLLSTECEFDDLLQGKTVSITDAYQRACQYLHQEISAPVKEIKKVMEHRLVKDVARINKYYDHNEAELESKLNKENLDGKKEEGLRQKIQINLIEKQRKILDMEKKHNIKVMIGLINVALISQPKVRCTIKLEGKKGEIEFDVFWDPLFKVIEEAYCPKCNLPTSQLWLQPDKMVLCKVCNGIGLPGATG